MDITTKHPPIQDPGSPEPGGRPVAPQSSSGAPGPADPEPEPHGGTPAQGSRLLRRPQEGRVAFGVAAALGRYFGIDPVIVRIGFVLITVFGGSGVLLYLIGLVAIPQEHDDDPVLGGAGRGEVPATVGPPLALVVGGVLLLIGVATLLSSVLPAAEELVGPVVVLSLGVVVLVTALRSRR